MLFGLALRAETVLLAHDGNGGLLRQAPAVLRTGGLALVGREALFGAASASIIDDEGRLHPVLWISAEDADAGVLEVFVGAQAPPGPHAASSMGNRVRVAGHAAGVRSTKEAGGFGIISRLDCGGPKEQGEPLYDEHGMLAGWHATREIDGQVLAFAVPLARFESNSRTIHVLLSDWNNSRSREKEAAYQRGMGHLWVEDFDGALFYFRKAVESQPENGRAWYHLAFAEGKSGHGKAKTSCYKKAVELDPGFAPAHYYLGFALLMNGDRDGALAEYKKLKELDESWATRLKLFLDAAHVDVLQKAKPHAERSSGPLWLG
ncbi:MAG: tetratricopeptide repeat protein [Acidobacteria bacterium]|nr:tetratricopeptide repeat protein [Acidobacteriota bacterium]